jgi:exodeoxyribonuclease VII large subunit
VAQLLNALSYKGVLDRGFALVRDEHGQPLHAAANINSGQRLNIEFADGRVGAIADGDGTPAVKPKAAPAKPASKRTTDFGVKKVQGDLF